jgi:hypothetical protein
MERRKFLKGLLGTTAVAVVGVGVERKYEWRVLDLKVVNRYWVVIKDDGYGIERLAA